MELAVLDGAQRETRGRVRIGLGQRVRGGTGVEASTAAPAANDAAAAASDAVRRRRRHRRQSVVQ